MTFIVKCSPVLKRWSCCCCSCGMRSATVLLGWMHMISAFTSFMMAAIMLGLIDDMHYFPVVGHDQENQMINTIMKHIYTISLVGTLGNMILYGLLLFGIHKKKPVFMLPFLVLQLVGLSISIVGVIVAFIIITVIAGAVGIMVLVIGIIVVAIPTFFWIVFYSYYRQLEDVKNTSSSHEILNYTYRDPNEQVALGNPSDPNSLFKQAHEMV